MSSVLVDYVFRFEIVIFLIRCEDPSGPRALRHGCQLPREGAGPAVLGVLLHVAGRGDAQFRFLISCRMLCGLCCVIDATTLLNITGCPMSGICCVAIVMSLKIGGSAGMLLTAENEGVVRNALVQCIHWAWQQHVDLGCEPMPFRL